MSAELDRRQEKTRGAIANAFVELLMERDYAEVTVAAVAERANVGRSTFYEHFKTRNDLLRHSVRPLFTIVATAVEPEGASPALLAILQHFRENHALARVMFYDNSRNVLLKALTQAIEGRLQSPAHLPPGLLAAQIAAAQFALLEPWILGQSSLPAEALATALCATSRALAEAG